MSGEFTATGNGIYSDWRRRAGQRSFKHGAGILPHRLTSALLGGGALSAAAGGRNEYYNNTLWPKVCGHTPFDGFYRMDPKE